MMDCQMNMASEDTTDPNTPRNLPTIQEGDVFFNQNDLDMYSSLGDKKSHSLYREPEAYGMFRGLKAILFYWKCFLKIYGLVKKVEILSVKV